MSRSIMRNVLLGGLLVALVLLTYSKGNAEQLPSTMAPNSAHTYLPWKYLVWKTVTQGWNGSFSHTGIMKYAYDFDLYNEYVYAVQGGTVAYTKADGNACGGQDFANYGNYVVINHPDGKATLYLHLLHNGVAVS